MAVWSSAGLALVNEPLFVEMISSSPHKLDEHEGL